MITDDHASAATLPRSVYWHSRPVLGACDHCGFPRDLHAATCPQIETPSNRYAPPRKVRDARNTAHAQ